MDLFIRNNHVDGEHGVMIRRERIDNKGRARIKREHFNREQVIITRADEQCAAPDGMEPINYGIVSFLLAGAVEVLI